VHEARFQSILIQIRELNPDVIYLQEANPAAGFTGRLSDSLDFDEIHHLCNAGFKFFGLGYPSGLNEGIAILAKKTLNLREFKIIKLNGIAGIYSDNFSFHFDESNFALVAKINISGLPVYLINSHLIASPPPDEELIHRYKKVASDSGEKSSVIDEAIKELYSKLQIRKNAFQTIREFTLGLPENSAVILGGDFNCQPNSTDIQYLHDSVFFDSFTNNYDFTWNPFLNDNTRFSQIQYHNEGQYGYSYLEALSDMIPKRLDYIFLSSKAFRKNNVISSKIVMNKRIKGVFPSDHFGVLTEISLDTVKKIIPVETNQIIFFPERKIDPIPIASFDTDVGFGLGAKALLLNYMKQNESFDMIVFGTTKGEIWTRFVFSIPHYELRQQKIYPISCDFVFDYDRFLNYGFFGIGNSSKFNYRENYTKEIMQINLNLSRGFSKELVLNGGLNSMYIRNYNLSDSSRLKKLSSLSSSSVTYFSIFSNFRYDSRNSFINPAKGFVAQFDMEYAPNMDFNKVSFGRLGLWLQNYQTLFFPTTVLAARIGLQGLIGSDLPVQVLLPIGGNRTLRGYPQDRFLDKVSSVFNVELRFPIFWRIGGLAGIDAGKVWHSPDKMDFRNWASNYVFGLRGYTDTFVIRADFGISRETTGIYLNFGHIF